MAFATGKNKKIPNPWLSQGILTAYLGFLNGKGGKFAA